MGIRGLRVKAEWFVFAVIGLVALTYQNCGPAGFRYTSQEGLDSSNSGLSASPTSTPGATATPAVSQTPAPSATPGTTPVQTPAPLQLKERSDATVLSPLQMQGSPKEGSIVQRRSGNKASLKIQPSVSSMAIRYFRYKLLSSTGAVIGSVSNFVAGQVVSVDVPAEMKLVQVQLQFFDGDGEERFRGTTSRFAVGDVFVVGGQSNAATHGEFGTQVQNSLNVAMSPQHGTWTLLRDPMPWASNWSLPQFGGKSNSGGSPWPTFADKLSMRTGVPVGMVNHAWGGSTVAHWLIGGNQDYFSYANEHAIVNAMIRSARTFSDCGFSAILWHQGESDSIAGTSRVDYKARMIQLRNKFVQETGCDRPWIIAQASFVPSVFNTPPAQMAAVAAAQQDLWAESGFKQGPNTDELTSSQYRYDTLHFSLQGLVVHGQLWAEKVAIALGL